MESPYDKKKTICHKCCIYSNEHVFRSEFAGGLGSIWFPIALSLIIHLNDAGTVKLFK